MQEAPRRPAAERAARLEQAEALLGEGGPGEQIDVGIKHERQHDHRPAERSDLGEPVVAGGGPAERLAEGGLDRTRIFELIGDHEGEDVARHRERQQERPGEDPAPREAVHGDEPRGAGPDDDGPDAHSQHEPERVRDVDRKDGGGEVPPGVVRRVDRPVRDGGERHRDERGDGDGGGRPAVDGGPPGVPEDGREGGHVTLGRERNRGRELNRSPDTERGRARHPLPAAPSRLPGGPPGSASVFISHPIVNTARRLPDSPTMLQPRPHARRGHPRRPGRSPSTGGAARECKREAFTFAT